MATRRTERLNSLLKKVISEVIHHDVANPHVNELTSVTRVDITRDLHYAKVYVSVIDRENRQQTIEALQSASGFISSIASKKVVMRYFPELTFILDDSADAHMRIETILKDLKDNRYDTQKTD